MRSRVLHIVILYLLLTVVNIANASVELPVDFCSEFDVNGLEGWTLYSTGETNHCLIGTPYGTGAFSDSQYDDGHKSDEWLISPEFEITDDNLILYYTVLATGNNLNNKYSVMISESGIDKSDFKVVATNTVQGSTGSVGFAMRRHALKGYKGKNVHLAFVNTGNSSGMVGFSEIGVGAYYIGLPNVDTFNNWIVSDIERPLEFEVNLSTPVKCNGFTAVLTAGDYTAEYKSGHISNLSTLTTDYVVFADIPVTFRGTHDYIMTITPDYEDAPATVISGTLIIADPCYPPVVLIEEMTSVKCTYCPRGTAFLNYFIHKYDGSDGGGRILAVALHSNGMGPDPMYITDNSYFTDADNVLSYVAPEAAPYLPAAMYNRTGGCDPATVPVDELMSRKGIARTNIKYVDYNIAESRQVTVDYETEVSYTASDAGLSASVIVTENNVSGQGQQWLQTNAFSQATMAQIIDMYGEELVPWFEPYVGKSSMLETTYNEVARGIYPSFTGMSLEGDFEAMLPRSFTIRFDMPSTVSDPSECNLILVITSTATGEVLTADMVSGNNFNTDLSSIHLVSAGIQEQYETEIYTLDGYRIYKPLNELSKGIYIERCGSNVRKIAIP
ncbi:MAG: hypothetical protein HDS13_06925 [Bacteroides sp.]|nr:hypothetical protein [Bacteroides sp.]